jgi:tetratricopeptide (TPR) repeat protein
MPLVERAPAKVNLGLHVLRKRPNGDHDVETVLHRIDWADTITAAPASTLSLTCSDSSLPTDDDNLCLRAARRLATAFDVTTGADLHLEKQVPYGAGLGGGSSDAAATLCLLSRLWDLDPSSEQLRTIGGKIGADVPFFLMDTPAAYATGRGDTLSLLSKDGEPCDCSRAALKRFRAAYDGPHPKIAQAQNNLAMLIHDQGRLEEAERLYRKTLATQKKLLSAPHPDLADTMNNLATVLRNLDKHAESKKRFRKVLRMDRALYGKEHPYVAGDYSNVASALMQRGQHAEAIGLLRQAEAITKKLLPATRLQLAGVYQKLGRCFVALEDYAHAEPALRKAFVIQRKREKGTQGDDRIDVLEDMVDLYDAWGRPAKAAAYRDTLAAFRDTLAAASGVEGS